MKTSWDREQSNAIQLKCTRGVLNTLVLCVQRNIVQQFCFCASIFSRVQNSHLVENLWLMQTITCYAILHDSDKPGWQLINFFTVILWIIETEVMEYERLIWKRQREGEKALQTFHTCPCCGSIVTKREKITHKQKFFLSSHKHNVQECKLNTIFLT